MSRRALIMTALVLALHGCEKKKGSADGKKLGRQGMRSLDDARLESVRILRALVICEGNGRQEASGEDGVVPRGGYVCMDSRGGLVICLAERTSPCVQQKGPAEAPETQ